MLSIEETILRLVVAGLMGSVIGLERERLNWVAGLRTHMLVCLGSALAMLVSMYGFNEVLDHTHVSLDPSRVAAQVVSGVGFLGAGTIFFWRKEIIRGLTTAAALWAVASIGLAIGGGMYIAGVATTALVLIILAGLKPIEKIFFKNVSTEKHALNITIYPDKISLKELEASMSASGVSVMEIKMEKSDEQHEGNYLLEIELLAGKDKLLALADELKDNKGIHSIKYK